MPININSVGQYGSIEQNFLDTWVQNRRFMTMKHWILLIYFGYYLLGFMFVLFPCRQSYISQVL